MAVPHNLHHPAVGLLHFVEALISRHDLRFFTHRVWVVSDRNKPLTALILVVGVAQMGFGSCKSFTQYPPPPSREWLIEKYHLEGLSAET